MHLIAVLRRAIVVFSLCSLSVPASAATYVLDPVAGSMNGDGSAQKPWGTLQAVLASRRTWQAGDVLMLKSGDHGQALVRGAAASGDVTISAAPGEMPRVTSLGLKNASRWIVKGLIISPEGQPETKSRISALVSIGGDCRDITLSDCELFSARDSSRWNEADWLARSITGISSAGAHCTIAGNRLRNVRFGIAIGRQGTGSIIARNLIENFMSDGMRGLADDCLFEENVVRNCFAIDDNHDDGFQSWTGGVDGVKVGGGVVKRVVLRGNTFISYTDPAQPFKSAMQGIGCFDGMFEDWIVENNVVVTDMWHGIAFYGAKNCRIVNNTVVKNPINAAARTPWIQISPHKRGTPSTGNLVRNNITPTLNVPHDAGVADHNVVTNDYAALFVDHRNFDLHLKAGSIAVDAGGDESAPVFDLDGKRRSPPFDVGAFEAGSTAATK
jgi:parallel beta-helix repeat protein